MANYMKDKSLKQIQPGSALNNINVPQQFQTGTYYPPGVQTPPPAIGQMGMGAQMGTAPIAQSDAELKSMMRDEEFRAEAAKTGEMSFLSSQHTPSADPFENIDVGFKNYGKGSAQPKSQEVVKHGKHTYLGGKHAMPSNPKETPVYGIKPGGKSYWNT